MAFSGDMAARLRCAAEHLTAAADAMEGEQALRVGDRVWLRYADLPAKVGKVVRVSSVTLPQCYLVDWNDRVMGAPQKWYDRDQLIYRPVDRVEDQARFWAKYAESMPARRPTLRLRVGDKVTLDLDPTRVGVIEATTEVHDLWSVRWLDRVVSRHYGSKLTACVRPVMRAKLEPGDYVHFTHEDGMNPAKRSMGRIEFIDRYDSGGEVLYLVHALGRTCQSSWYVRSDLRKV